MCKPCCFCRSFSPTTVSPILNTDENCYSLIWSFFECNIECSCKVKYERHSRSYRNENECPRQGKLNYFSGLRLWTSMSRDPPVWPFPRQMPGGWPDGGPWSAGYQAFTGREYIPVPLTCYKCQKFCHTAPACRDKQRCSKCNGEHEYGSCTSEKNVLR